MNHYNWCINKEVVQLVSLLQQQYSDCQNSLKLPIQKFLEMFSYFWTYKRKTLSNSMTTVNENEIWNGMINTFNKKSKWRVLHLLAYLQFHSFVASSELNSRTVFSFHLFSFMSVLQGHPRRNCGRSEKQFPRPVHWKRWKGWTGYCSLVKYQGETDPTARVSISSCWDILKLEIDKMKEEVIYPLGEWRWGSTHTQVACRWVISFTLQLLCLSNTPYPWIKGWVGNRTFLDMKTNPRQCDPHDVVHNLFTESL
jgi:hypothetical protein